MRTFVFVCLAAAALAGCSQFGTSKNATPASTSAYKNGRAIFLTGKDAAGFRVLAERPPLRTSCAACHGRNGAGGVHLPGGAVSADLRYKALVVDQKHPYTLTSLERAISTGIDNAGNPLDPVMPHWRMTGRDLHDVAEYVLTLK